MQRILVIEDTREHRENMSEILTLNGYQVITACNGKSGVEAALKENPDLILCDIMMPELDGYAVLQILSKNQMSSDIPFLFLTAKAEKEDFRRGMAMGADDYIVKPFDVDQLLQSVEKRLQKHQRLRQSSEKGSHFETFVNEAKAQELLHHLSDERELRRYHKKEEVFAEGGHPRYLFYVESGAVKVFKTNEDGREFIVRIAGPGEYMGYLALQMETPYSESAVALDDSDIRLIPKEDFFKLLNSNRCVNARFVKMLANHVAEQEQMLIDLAYNSVRKRVATALIQLYDQGKINLHLQRDDLASLIGTAKETLVRTLSSFKTEGLLDMKDGQVNILQPQKLRDMPN